jgi:hypothetical protein
MRKVAGFSPHGGTYFLPQAVIEPPEILLQQVFPWLDELTERHQAQLRFEDNFENGGLDESDQARSNFLRILWQLRSILLQDLAVLQPEYPNMVVFTQPIFGTQEWQDFAHTVRSGLPLPGKRDATSKSLLLEQAVPEIVTSLTASTMAITQQASIYHSVLAERPANVEHAVNAIATGKITVQFGQGIIPLPILGGASIAPVNDPLPALPSSYQPQLLENGSARLVFSSSEPTTTTLPPTTTTSQLEDPPEYIMAANQTVPDLWRELTVGFFGNPSIEALDRRWGFRWRNKPRRVVTFYSKRKVIIDAIYAGIKRGRSPEEAIAAMEIKRKGGAQGNSTSLNSLSKQLVKERQARSNGVG